MKLKSNGEDKNPSEIKEINSICVQNIHNNMEQPWSEHPIISEENAVTENSWINEAISHDTLEAFSYCYLPENIFEVELSKLCLSIVTCKGI